MHMKGECFTVIHNTLKSVFKNVAIAVADIPSFGCCWGFNLATDSDTFSTYVRRARLGSCFFFFKYVVALELIVDSRPIYFFVFAVR